MLKLHINYSLKDYERLLGNKMMTQTKPDHDTENPFQENYYEIRVKGKLIPLWEEWFEGLTATILEDDQIILSGPVADQAALHGLIAKLRNLNLELVSIKKL